MKIDLVRTIVAIGIGALIGWGFYAMAQDSMDGQPLGFAIGIETALLGIGLVGIEYEEYPRSGTMIRATCALGALVLFSYSCRLGDNTSTMRVLCLGGHNKTAQHH